MKVLVVQDSLLPAGGSEVAVVQILQALRDIGAPPVAICGVQDRSLLSGVTICEAPELFHSNPRIDLLQSTIERELPDLVHIHKVGSPQVIRYAAERLPTIVTMHAHNAYCPGGSKVFWRSGTLCQRPLGYQCLVHAYADGCAARHPARLWRQFQYSKGLLSALKGVKRVLTLSRYVRSQLVRSGLEDHRVRVLEPWVPLHPPSLQETQSHVVLFVGRIVREKGLRDLIRALPLLSAPFKAVVVGDGPLRSHCEKLAQDLGISQFVEFRGWLSADDLRVEYRRCAVLVFPSFWPEPFGLVGIEAMAHGKPVVATDVGGVRDWLVDGVTGILVQRGDVPSLARAIEGLLTDEDRRNQIGAAGRAYVAEHFDKQTNFNRLLATYNELLQ